MSAIGDARALRTSWLELTLLAPPGPAADLLSEALFCAGSSGIEERGASEGGRVELVAWFPFSRLPLDAAPIAALGATVRSSRTVPDEDWEERFFSGLAPIELGRRIAIVPVRCEAPPPGRVALRLDPGCAFGTGLHPTTALAAALLEEAIERRGGGAVLDVGTGSGILAIAAYLLGARPVLAIDTDPDALAEASSNARRNGCRDAFEASERPLESIGARFDIVVANLDGPALAALSGRLAERVAPEGELIVSGLREAEAMAPPWGLERAETIARDHWRAERWRRP
jgi:ribosomal protein L11 methyltransferase